MDILSSDKAQDSDSSIETVGSGKNVRSKQNEKNPKSLTSTNPTSASSNRNKERGNATSSSSPVPKSLNRLPENFLLSLTGRIEWGEVFGINDIYCKYNFSYGPDWQITTGLEEGISQITTKDLNGKFVWNFPLEVTFKSSNPHGWPQLVVSFYGSDFLGNHVARGYGATFVPIHQGSSTKTIPLFVPESSSLIQKISSWIVGRRPEFVDPKIVAQSEGRQVVRVQSCGQVTVRFEAVLKDFRKLGYVSSSSRSAEDYSV